VTKQNDVIRRLQEDVDQLERAAEESLRRTRTESEKQEAAERKNSEGKMAKLLQELAEVRAEYANVLATHRSGEQALRKVGDLTFRSEPKSVCGRGRGMKFPLDAPVSPRFRALTTTTTSTLNNLLTV